MPMHGIEEGKFFSLSANEVTYLSGCFVHAVRNVCRLEEMGGAVLELIREYVWEDPNSDVLAETKRAFSLLERGGKCDLGREEFFRILERIKKIYYIALPGYTLERYRDDLDNFFNHIYEYASGKIF